MHWRDKERFNGIIRSTRIDWVLVYKPKGQIKKKNYSSLFRRMAKVVRAAHKSCQDCASGKHLQVHHSDKDKSNNLLSNLRLLCFDCHSKHHAHLRLPNWIRS